MAQSDSPNLALGKPTFESDSTSDPIEIRKSSTLAVDGNTDGNYADGSVTHNGTADPNAYWYVDLQGSYSISAINIWGRTDCCQDRLNGATVSVFAAGQSPNTSTTPVWSGHIGTVPTPSGSSQLVSTFAPAITGQYVMVRLNPNSVGYLSLAEVQVYGTAVSQTPDSFSNQYLLTQVADGGGWRTTFSLINPSATAVDYRLQLKDDSGAP